MPSPLFEYILGEQNWTQTTEDQAAAIVELVQRAVREDWLSVSETAVSFRSLPFYEHYLLYRIHTPQGGGAPGIFRYCLVHGDDVLPIGWRSAAFEEASKRDPGRVTADNVIEYAWLILAFLVCPGTVFVEGPDTLYWSDVAGNQRTAFSRKVHPPRLIGTTPEGHFIVGFNYVEWEAGRLTLLESRLHIPSTGVPEDPDIKDVVLMANVPASAYDLRK